MKVRHTDGVEKASAAADQENHRECSYFPNVLERSSLAQRGAPRTLVTVLRILTRPREMKEAQSGAANPGQAWPACRCEIILVQSGRGMSAAARSDGKTLFNVPERCCFHASGQIRCSTPVSLVKARLQPAAGKSRQTSLVQREQNAAN